ncbi:MAG: hypothetical protein ACPGRG_05420, partial [Marinomonas sp.]
GFFNGFAALSSSAAHYSHRAWQSVYQCSDESLFGYICANKPCVAAAEFYLVVSSWHVLKARRLFGDSFSSRNIVLSTAISH